MIEAYFSRKAIKKDGFTNAQIDEVIKYNQTYIYEHGLTSTDLKIYFEAQANFEKLRLKNLENKKVNAGDSLEIWSNNNHVFYSNAFINKCSWNKSGLEYCESARVHTNTDISYFSVSGGSFNSNFVPNDCKLIGIKERLIWTWGRVGACGNGGLYIPVKANLYKLVTDKKYIPYVIKRICNKDFGYKYSVETWHKTNFNAETTCKKTLSGIKNWLKDRNLKIGKKLNHNIHTIVGDVESCMLMSKKEYDSLRGNLREFPQLSNGEYTTAFLKDNVVYYCNPNVKDRIKLPNIYD